MRHLTAVLTTAALLAACTAPKEMQKTDMSLTDSRATTDTIVADPHLWLEEVEGDRALGWVRAQNTRSLAAIQAHPAYADNLA